MRVPPSLVVALCAAALVAGCGDDVNQSTTTSSGAGGSGGASSSGTGGSSSGAGGSGGTVAGDCFADHHWPVAPDYDQYDPIIADHCAGTNHQTIEGIEKLVFLGDSVTEGTPPTPVAQFYRTLLADQLSQTYPGLEVTECAAWGARVRDLLGGDEQIPSCFPGPEPKRTLVVMTMGGNDIMAWAEDLLPYEQAMEEADDIAADLQAAIEWFYDDPNKFPAGVFVVFANPYEFTDGTGELGSCPGAAVIGLGGNYMEGAAAVSYLQEQFLRIAVETGTDMVFSLEAFCGHGFMRDTINACYVGPNAEAWFDLTCIHPNPAGHAAMADLFQTVIDE
ncbi:MAG: SGNH/GDSL hydrolase family protein [Deltaproteobacteria bacterium]|nr:SGNH/GDSL hydrolase family protein [Deltaproteobacteria bacterium]